MALEHMYSKHTHTHTHEKKKIDGSTSLRKTKKVGLPFVDVRRERQAKALE